MKKVICIIVCLCSVLFSYADSYGWTADRFSNYSIGVGYDRVNYTIGDYRVTSNNITVYVMFYGVYVDCSISPERSDYDRFARWNPRVWGMDFGYAVPLFPKNAPVRVFITPMVGFTSAKVLDCYDYYRNTTKVNGGGAVGLSFNKLYLQFKITNTQMGGSVGFIF